MDSTMVVQSVFLGRQRMPDDTLQGSGHFRLGYLRKSERAGLFGRVVYQKADKAECNVIIFACR